MLRETITIILAFLCLSARSQVPAAEWVVPDEAGARTCPFPFSPESVKAGDEVFQKNCKSCHGDIGKQNFAKLTPHPGDPASADFQKQTDGEMFYRVTTGKAPMPTFGSILSDEERWQVISYIRSFNKSYVQPAPVAKGGGVSKSLKLRMYCNYRQKKLFIVCNELMKDKKEIPARGVELVLNVKRYFGIMKTGESKTTNANGLVKLDFPSDVPGGMNGILELSVRVNDESGRYFANTVKEKLAIGKCLQLKSLTDARAMWSVRARAPIWLILTFSLSVIAVWGTIFYILFLLIKLKQANQNTL